VNNAPALRVAIRSDRRLFRDSLAACLAGEPHLTVVGHVAEPAELVSLYDLCHPDVVLYDLGSGVTQSLTALPTVRQQCRRAHLVVVYDRLSSADLAVAWQGGADTLVPASHGLDALVVVLKQYLCGTAEPPRSADDVDVLTDQEREIITLVGAGHTANRIAELLQVSANAVEHSKRRIYHKLDVVCQSQAVARAVTLGLLDRPPDARYIPTPTVNGVILVMLRGPEVEARREAAVTLLEHGIAFVSEGPNNRCETEPWDRWHRGPIAMVLIDPKPDDWPSPDEARAPVVLVHADPLRRAEALEAIGRGVAAIVASDRITEDLVPALTLALHGYVTMNAAEAHAIVAAARSRPLDADGLPDLTSRECDILRSIACGHTVRQTARSLNIAEKTVENTQARLFRKLGARNRAGALAAAHALGLLELVEQNRSRAAS
jgi:two-component system nitrate/nitrite response regulator NarL